MSSFCGEKSSCVHRQEKGEGGSLPSTPAKKIARKETRNLDHAA